MLHENTMVRNAAADLQQIFMSENPDATAVEAAFDQFGQAIAASVLADYQSANGDKVILAGHYWNGAGKPSYYGAVYEFLTDDTGCEGEIGIREVSGVEFEDEGHALEWAIKNAN